MPASGAERRERDVKYTRHLVVLTALTIFLLGFWAGSSVAMLDKRDAMLRGYTHGYIDALTGEHDPSYWHHVTMKLHVQSGDILSGGGFGASQTYRIEDRH
jgi:hypothetical protein